MRWKKFQILKHFHFWKFFARKSLFKFFGELCFGELCFRWVVFRRVVFSVSCVSVSYVSASCVSARCGGGEFIRHVIQILVATFSSPLLVSLISFIAIMAIMHDKSVCIKNIAAEVLPIRFFHYYQTRTLYFHSFYLSIHSEADLYLLI